jgi:hypothetical protein
MNDKPDLLTVDERAFVKKAGALYSDLCKVVGPSELTRDADLREAVFHVHALQNMVLSQAARRAYPEEFRMLGGTPEWVERQ